MSRIEIDWKLNVGHIVSVVLFVGGGVSGWYAIKSDVALVQKDVASLNKRFEDQEKRDKSQDDARERLSSELKQTLKDNKDEIKQEIRDLRTDLFRQQRIAGPTR
jgi:flagellar motility protein MotE (MotC chaperone)